MLDLELLHVIDRGCVQRDLDSAFLLDVRRGYAIDQNIGGSVASPIRNEVVRNASTGYAARNLMNPGRKIGQVEHRALEQRQVIDEDPVQLLACHRILRGEYRRRRGNFHRLGLGSDLEAHING